MKLIKQLTEDMYNARLEELAETDSLASAELVARRLGILNEDHDELARIASYWRSNGGLSMTDRELADAVSNDLEQLDYSPEDIEKFVPRVVKLIKKGM